MNVFEQQQFIPGHSVEKVFDFFSTEKNLEILTPPWIHFHVVGKSTPQVQEGTRIQYRLKIHGIPTRWESIIEEWIPHQRFVDRQLKGPYRYWHHTHLFESKDGGTLISDRVLYLVPFGYLGQLATGWLVRRDVQKIFHYRTEQIGRLFG